MDKDVKPLLVIPERRLKYRVGIYFLIPFFSFLCGIFMYNGANPLWCIVIFGGIIVLSIYGCRINYDEDLGFIILDREGIKISGYPTGFYSPCFPLSEDRILWPKVREVNLCYTGFHKGYRSKVAAIRIDIVTWRKQHPRIRLQKGTVRVTKYVPLGIGWVKRGEIDYLIETIKQYSDKGTVVEWKGTKRSFWA